MHLVNTKIRLSYTHFYNRGISLNKVLPKQVSEDFAVTLSAIGYDAEVLRCFKAFCLSNFCATDKQYRMLQEEELIEPHTSYLAWKLIFTRSKIVMFTESYKNTAKQLFDFLLKVNSILDEEDASVPRKLATLYSEHLFIDFYHDNIVAQFNRTQKIFLDSSILKPYIKIFESQNDVGLKEYVYIIYRLLVRYGNIWVINHDGFTSSQFTAYWKSSSSDIAEETNFEESSILKVVNCISKGFYSFQKEAINNSFDYTNINVFKNFPFLRLEDGSIIPINNRLSENLIFYNLFYKIADADKKMSERFRCDFGKEFENYVTKLASIVAESGNNDCIIQTEFTYSKNRKAGANKSPDLMIVYPENKQVIVFEVKSAQILDAYNRNYSNKEAYETSIEKTVFRPLIQAGKAIKDINDANATDLFDETYRYLYVSITMTGFMIPNYKINLFDEDDIESTIDVSNYFYNMPIETFEIFIRMLTAPQRINGFELLYNYNKKRDEMSLKTYLHRKEKELNLDISFFESKMLNGQNDYLAYITQLKNR